jgi:hypothetical protein
VERIKKILALHSGPYYFDECTQGKHLTELRLRAEAQAFEELEGIDLAGLLTNLSRLTPFGEFRAMCERYGLETGLHNVEKEELVRELIIRLSAERVAQSRAKEFGCQDYAHCLLCPVGQRIVAEEIYNYAMGGGE